MKPHALRLALLALALPAGLGSCMLCRPEPPHYEPFVTAAGVHVQDVVVPEAGAVATPGDQVTIDYAMRLASGELVDSSRERGTPASFVLGTGRLYDFVDGNPMIEMRGVDYTNDTAVIRKLRRMTAINSAIEIDLTGQVVADSIGPRFYSGVGGQMDFVRGASLAPEGRAIIALPSTAANGTISRITPFLREGAGVVTTRAHARTIVTEWGVAELHGRSILERARALIDIAHPDFRDELEHTARRTHFL